MLLILACIYDKVVLLAADLPFFFFKSGGHLLSHTVSSAVPSAACVLTVVFGMGTGVSHKRIATRKITLAFDSFDNSTINNNPYYFFLRKEVIQPHLPIRLPCYDFTPVISPAFSSFLSWITDFGHYQLPWCDGRCVQDPGTYSPRHSDSRLLAIPASCSRVADYNPN